MQQRLKQYFLIGLALAVFYFVLSHHILFTSYKDVHLLKKEKLTMEYTFYNLRNAEPKDTLKIDVLRDAGVENIMLDEGLITEEKLDQLLLVIDGEKAKQKE